MCEKHTIQVQGAIIPLSQGFLHIEPPIEVGFGPSRVLRVCHVKQIEGEAVRRPRVLENLKLGVDLFSLPGAMKKRPLARFIGRRFSMSRIRLEA